MFVQGEELILAVDAYNGTPLWQRQIPGAVRPRVDVDGGNLALTEEALYVAAYDRCLRLDPATGATVRVYNLPEAGGGQLPLGLRLDGSEYPVRHSGRADEAALWGGPQSQACGPER